MLRAISPKRRSKAGVRYPCRSEAALAITSSRSRPKARSAFEGASERKRSAGRGIQRSHAGAGKSHGRQRARRRSVAGHAPRRLLRRRESGKGTLSLRWMGPLSLTGIFWSIQAAWVGSLNVTSEDWLDRQEFVYNMADARKWCRRCFRLNT